MTADPVADWSRSRRKIGKQRARKLRRRGEPGMDKEVMTSDLGAQTYLGDGAYVHIEYGSIVLTTHDGLRETNRIVLEPEVWFRLKEWEKSAT